MRKIFIGGEDGVCIVNASTISKKNSLDKIVYLDTSSIVKNVISNLQELNKNDAPSRAQRKVKENTIIYSTVRPNQEHFGILKYPCENMIVSTGFVTLDVIDENIDAKYLYYRLTQREITDYLNKIAETSVSSYPSINPSDIARLSFIIPNSKKVQQEIANTLTVIDDKIELNNKINRNLDIVLSRLYYYWFVQFDFPNEEGKPYKSSGGKMVWNEKLKKAIPEGWTVDKISSLIEQNKGGDWGKDEPVGNYIQKVSCIRGADINYIKGNDTNSDLPERYILEKNSHKLLSANDIVIEISGGSPTQSTGRAAMITEKTIERFDNPLICSNFCQAITLKDANQAGYFFYMWSMFYDQNIFFNYEGKTSGIKNFLFDSFVANEWYIPSQAIVYKFQQIVDSIYKKKESLLKQNKHLTACRDWLLPLLMSGQVKVKPQIEESVLNIAAEPVVEYKSSNSQRENYHKIESVYVILWANKLLGVQQGEMALAKDTYLVDKLAGIKTGFTFAQHNWGSYDPTFKKTINNKQFFARRNFENSKAIYFDLNDNGKLLARIPEVIKESVRKAIEELHTKIFDKYHWSKKAEMKELYATVLKCIEDTQSVEVTIIRQAMMNWKTPKQDFPDKASKFSIQQTQEVLDIIIKEGWDLKVINREKNM